MIFHISYPQFSISTLAPGVDFSLAGDHDAMIISGTNICYRLSAQILNQTSRRTKVKDF
jgi:hypothetical protein